MHHHLIIVAALSSLAACVTVDDEASADARQRPGLVGVEVHPGADVPGTIPCRPPYSPNVLREADLAIPVDLELAEDVGACDALPGHGPCALACDPAGLAAAYVPAGSCATFACVAHDGTLLATTACHVR